MPLKILLVTSTLALGSIVAIGQLTAGNSAEIGQVDPSAPNQRGLAPTLKTRPGKPHPRLDAKERLSAAEAKPVSSAAGETSASGLISSLHESLSPAASPATQIVTTVAGLTRFPYGNGGPATAANLDYPSGVAVDPSGAIYIFDGGNCQVRRVDPATGLITAAAGSGGFGYTGDGQLALNAQISGAGRAAFDAAGNLFFTDSYYVVVREVNALTGIISTVAGTGTYGFSGDGGPATQAAFNNPTGIVVDSAGNLYVADTGNSVVRKVTRSTGIISTIAGMGSNSGYSGDGGPATQAELSNPSGVAVDSGGNVYIADTYNSVIRVVSAATGKISTYAGNGTYGNSGDGGPAAKAEFSFPEGISLDKSGNLYIDESYNYAVRKVEASTGLITTIAGNGTEGFSGDGGPGTQAQLFLPNDVAPDASGNVFIADETNNRIRRVDSSTGNIATVAGNGLIGPIDNGAAAVTVPIVTYYPNGMVADASQNIYFTDAYDNLVRKISAADGALSVVAGSGQAGYSGDGGPAASAELNFPLGFAIDSQGNLYIADSGNAVVRRVDHSTGVISTFAGNGTYVSAGDGGAATSASLEYPTALTFDSAGNLYIADQYSFVVREVNSEGTISTVAGNGQLYYGTGSNGDGEPATSASLGYPDALAVDAHGNLYIGDFVNPVVREVNASTGIINTVVGNGQYTESGDGGSALNASIEDAYGLAFDTSGNLYIADGSAIHVVNSSGIINTLAGQGEFGYSGDGGPAALAEVSSSGVAVDSASNVYFSDGYGNRIRKIWTSAVQPAVATPTLAPAPGSYGSTQAVTLADTTPGAQIFYTLDGSTPNPGSSNLYTGPISLIGSVTVSAIAIAPGYSTSTTGAASYTFPSPTAGAAATPAFTLAGGSYIGAQTVAITDATLGAVIHFNTTGATPTAADAVYTGPITLGVTNGVETIEAIAVATGYANSAAASVQYTVTLPATTTTLTSSANPQAFGSQVTFNVAVAPTTGNGVPTGTVTLAIDGNTASALTLDNTGHASYSTTTLSVGQHAISAAYSGDANYAGSTGTLTETISPPGLQFIPVTPCRVADTRNPAGPFGGPEPAAGSTRTFDIPQSGCKIPSTAVAYSLNVTVVPNAALGYLTMWPSGQAQPLVSTLNSDGRVKANAAIVPAGSNGGVSVYVTNPTQVILDIDGYFVPAGTANALAFYPVTPCRIADTRNSTGPLGGPSLAANTSRAFPVQSSACKLPSTAQAYSLNVTAVPHTTLGYLTIWPTGEAQPNVSTLNAPTGAVTANAAIVPAGSGGDVSVFVDDAADVILDVNGYFAPPATGGLSLYTATPCRAKDTRPTAFTATLTVNIEGSTCAPPATAEAYVLNATVVPDGALGYLTLWPAGASQPLVSTLNAADKAITSNMAIVPTTNGNVDAYADGTTNLILDLSGYFAPVSPALKSIAVTGTTSLVVGQSQQLTATATYSDGTTKDVTSLATWTSSSTAIITVSATGLATAVAPGMTTISATLSSISGMASVTVAPTLTSISVTPATASLAIGKTQQFAATATYSDGSTKDVSATATWASSATTDVTISATGLATAVAPGMSTISATLSGVAGSATLTVTGSPISITVTVAGLTGTGLVLQLNSSDNLPVTANGSYTFTNQLTTGTAYTVTVFTEPTGQVCTITNSSGTTGSTNIANVRVACAIDLGTTTTMPTLDSTLPSSVSQSIAQIVSSADSEQLGSPLLIPTSSAGFATPIFAVDANQNLIVAAYANSSATTLSADSTAIACVLLTLGTLPSPAPTYSQLVSCPGNT